MQFAFIEYYIFCTIYISMVNWNHAIRVWCFVRSQPLSLRYWVDSSGAWLSFSSVELRVEIFSVKLTSSINYQISLWTCSHDFRIVSRFVPYKKKWSIIRDRWLEPNRQRHLYPRWWTRSARLSACWWVWALRRSMLLCSVKASPTHGHNGLAARNKKNVYSHREGRTTYYLWMETLWWMKWMARQQYEGVRWPLITTAVIYDRTWNRGH